MNKNLGQSIGVRLQYVSLTSELSLLNSIKPQIPFCKWKGKINAQEEFLGNATWAGHIASLWENDYIHSVDDLYGDQLFSSIVKRIINIFGNMLICYLVKSLMRRLIPF